LCGVLNHQPDGGSWGYCSEYVDPAATAVPVPSDDRIGAAYRLLVVPGIFGECVQDYALPWEDARRHLHDAHQTDVEYLPVSALGSSGSNAKDIIAYIAAAFGGSDKRPYIAVGYSKGAPDILEALIMDASTRERIAAVVTIAGAVLGSRLAEGIPRGILDPLRDLKLGPCSIKDGGAPESLRRSVRAEAMTKLPPLRGYSIAAVSRLETTSLALANGWRQLQPFSADQDSQVIREDAILPGGVYLGTALADHWAVALPFERVVEFHPNTPKALVDLFHTVVNHNHYPRAALFEAAIRFAVADMGH
jgi:hypothetical protein